MLNSKVPFIPIRGKEDSIFNEPPDEGKVWFAIDTHKIYYSDGNEFILMGGGNTGIFYASFDSSELGDNTGEMSIMNPAEIFANYIIQPRKDDLVINESDQCFYRVLGYEEDGSLSVYRLALAGSGNDGSSKVRGRLVVTSLGETELLNGEECSFSITATSATEDGQPIDPEDMKLTITYMAAKDTEPYYTEVIKVAHGQTLIYKPEHLRQSTSTDLMFVLSGSPGNIFVGGGQVSRNVTTYAMDISWINSRFTNLSYFRDNFTVAVQILGGSRRILDIYFDDYLIYSKMENEKTTDVEINVRAASEIVDYDTHESTGVALGASYNHGRHTISAKLSLVKSDGTRGSGTDVITREVGLYLNEQEPLIWFGDVKKTYYEFDTPAIPIRAYDPNNSVMHLYLYENSKNVSGEDGRAVDRDKTAYEIWELTNLVAGQTTVYQIRVGDGEHEAMERVPEFTVLPDERHMGIVDGAIVNFDARGRSNSESAKKRSVIEIRDSKATLSNFNWYNNGWIMEDNSPTCLRISNGASVSFPIGSMAFAGQNKSSHTIEFKMKISNIQNYDKIITTYTRYQVVDNPSDSNINRGWKDDEVFEQFLAQRATGYSSYDAYLAMILPKLRLTDNTIPTYEDLEFASLSRQYNLDTAVIKYLVESGENEQSNPGICLGAQDGYFTNGTNSVAIDFVEDQILNIAIVYDKGSGTVSGNDNLMKFYLNGVLTSVARSTLANRWIIDTENLIVNSTNCDIDLYKFRVYDQALTLTQILQNMAYDNTDTTAWDLSNLAITNNDINEPFQFSYNKMIAYNDEHTTDPIMPYIVFTTDDSDVQSKGNLPWKKSIPITVDMEFVNTGLDAAYASGDLNVAAGEVDIADYYEHHCPSWSAEGVTLSVQGTSSEYYPRRNYKAKAKGKMKMNRGPFVQDKEKSLKWFYYDNDTVGCNKFTLKVDYMESSGSYNMGLANLVNYVYSHHPLADYNKVGAFSVVDTENQIQTKVENEASLYDPNTVYYYYNHKGTLKNTSVDELKSLASAEDFAKGPRGYAISIGQEKVLGGIGAEPNYSKVEKTMIDTNENCTNVWYTLIPAYKTAEVTNLSDYRTSAQGFPTLAFWQTKTMKENNQEPLFIGRYNMLLDKGADEAYGFKGLNVLSAFNDNKSMDDIAECWEFENNSRGFCSFRDPWNRRELTFAAPAGVKNSFTASNAPIVADSFEYRYNALDDYIDYLVDLNTSAASGNEIKEDIQNVLGIDITNLDEGRAKLLELYGNWEKAVAWVWSTATDAKIDLKGDGTLVSVPDLNSYSPIDLAEALYESNKYYIATEANKYTLAQGNFDSTIIYFCLEDGNYRGIKLTIDAAKVYAPSKYYTTNESLPLEDRTYVLAEDTFDASEIYYEPIEQTEFDDAWKLAAPVTYGKKTYNYDTKEYRLAKFKNELEDHFNLEYLATYFIITEVLECYDSRGKNCMMASWGPQEAGGEYIWYPIFYDMDTQLGINNTGIPSFDYNIDATNDGTFSTNDSVLWNNFYATYFNLIREKYRQLKGNPSNNFGGKLTVSPFNNVEIIESIYNCDPTFTKSYSMQGRRPLIASNLDEQYKYISITNPEVGYLGSGDSPVLQVDDSNTYFYALQGNRSMSREQFLINRLNYIDSWLTVGNYERNGANNIRSRISANNSIDTSDLWVEGENEENYWTSDNVKTHMFDGEYWITMTPVRDMYVTVGTDTANFPSLKYTGTPIRFSAIDLENGVRQSKNYREQLYYIYGLDQMRSLGDLSKLYFQEFVLSGSANKLTDLCLGYDGLDEGNRPYKNENVNAWNITGSNGLPLVREINLCNIKFKNENITFDLSKSPKLQVFRDTGSNIVGVTFAEGVALNTLYLSNTTRGLNLTEARLLTNLIEEYKIPELQLDQTLLAEPGLYIAGLTDWEDKGEDSIVPALTSLSINGGNLGYYSYALLNKYYNACKNEDKIKRQIDLTSVQWSPYVLVTDTDLPVDTSGNYYYDNGHYGLVVYTEADYTADKSSWKRYLNNNQLYEYDESKKLDSVNITNIDLFKNLIDNSIFVSSVEDSTVPNISGYVYIDNETAVDEGTIYNKLSVNYPNLHLFFKNVNKGYVAKFVIQEETLGSDGEMLITQTVIGTERINAADYSDTKFFTSPFDRADNGERLFQSSYINNQRPAQDFLGWGSANDSEHLVLSYDKIWIDLLGNSESIRKWDELRLTQDVYDYTFYAVFQDHKWKVSFMQVPVNANGNAMRPQQALTLGGATIDYEAVHGTTLHAPIANLQNVHQHLKLEDRTRFIGYTRTIAGNNTTNIYNNEHSAALVDFSKIAITEDNTFYAAYVLENVYQTITDDSYFTFTLLTSPITVDGIQYSGYSVSPNPYNPPYGKITIPSQYNGQDIINIAGFGHSTSVDQALAAYVTYVFFEKNHPLKRIDTGAFRRCERLEYFDFDNLPMLYSIGAFAFNMVHNLKLNYGLGSSVQVIYPSAFAAAFTHTDSGAIFTIPGSVKEIGCEGMAWNDFANYTLCVGSSQSPSQLSIDSSLLNHFSSYAYGPNGGSLLQDTSEMLAIGQNSGYKYEDIYFYGTPTWGNNVDLSQKFSQTVSGITITTTLGNFFGYGRYGSPKNPITLIN